MQWSFLDRLAREAVLDEWTPESVAFYACVDGPVLVIWGKHGDKLAIRGITIDIPTLNEDSQFRVVWERFKAKELTIADVHKNILDIIGSPSN